MESDLTASATGAFTASLTLPWARGDRPDTEGEPHQLIEQMADLALGQVIARAQHPDQRQGPRAQMTSGYTRRQAADVALAAARAPAAMQPVLVDDRLHRRDVEDLMALRRLVIGNDRAAAPALRPAIVDPVDVAFRNHRAAVPLVTGLGTALLRAGPALGAIRPARAIRGCGLDELFESRLTRSSSA